MRCSGALRLLGVAAVMAVALGGSIVDCEGTELHELVVKYDTDSSDTINSSELLNMSLDLGLPLTSDEAEGVVTKYGSNSGELTDSQLCNYINTMLTDSTSSSSSSKSSSRGSKKIKPEDGGKDLFDMGKETYAPTPENLYKAPTKKPSHERKLKSSKVDTINFVETFNPTPENKKRQLKKGVDTINFEETFNPTPEGPKGGFGTLKTKKSSHERTLKSSKVDTINFVETFNPTPENKKRQLKSSKKPEDGGKDLFDAGKETYAPTPENLYKSPTKKPSHERRLKKTVDTINYEETFNPTPDNLKRRTLKTASLRGGLAVAADETDGSIRSRVQQAIQALQALL